MTFIIPVMSGGAPTATVVVGSASGKGYDNFGYNMTSYGALYAEGATQTNSTAYADTYKLSIPTPLYALGVGEVTYLYQAIFNIGSTEDEGSLIITLLSNNTNLYDNRTDSFGNTEATLAYKSVNVNGSTFSLINASKSISASNVADSASGYYIYQAFFNNIARADNPFGTTDDAKIDVRIQS
jgi:hypothetical protein